jgi:hypothetical protein
MGRARLLTGPPAPGFDFIREVPHDYTRPGAGPGPAHENESREWRAEASTFICPAAFLPGGG